MDQITEIDKKVQCVIHELRNDAEWVNFKRSMVRAPQIIKKKAKIGYQLPLDEDFEAMNAKFQEIDQRIALLETEVMRYTGYVRTYIIHSLEVADAFTRIFNPELTSMIKYGPEASIERTHVKISVDEERASLRFAMKYTDRITMIKGDVDEDLEMVINSVHLPLASLSGLIKNIRRYIKERDFASLDVNRYYDDFQTLNSRDETTLTLKQQQNLIRYEKNYELSKLKFEQINDILKCQLPQFFKLVGEFINTLHGVFYFLQLGITYSFFDILNKFDDIPDKQEILETGIEQFSEILTQRFQWKNRPSKDLIEHMKITSLTCVSLTDAPLTTNDEADNLQRNAHGIANKSNRYIAKSHSTTEPPEPVPKAKEFCVAKYNYRSQQEGDISFRRGQRIEILSRVVANWWVGRTEDGQEGMFPYNYVDIEY